MSVIPGVDVTLAKTGTLFSGGHRLNHGLNDNQEMERMYADWVEDCESQSFKIHDENFQKWSDRTGTVDSQSSGGFAVIVDYQ